MTWYQYFFQATGMFVWAFIALYVALKIMFPDKFKR